MTLIELDVIEPTAETIEYFEKRVAELGRFSQKSPERAIETATELVVSGLASKHFSILPNSAVILDVDGLYCVTIKEGEGSALCEIYFAKDDIAGLPVYVYKTDDFSKEKIGTYDANTKDAIEKQLPNVWDHHRFFVVPWQLPEKIKSFFFLLCATIVRDFWVLEERSRHRVYQKRTEKVRERVGTGKDRHLQITKTHLYLPRVKYDLSAYEGTDRKVSEQVRETLSPHFVSGHLRLLPAGHRASAEAKQQAAEFGITLAPGYTFVRPHRKGEVERMRMYRSRSALELIFGNTVLESKGE